MGISEIWLICLAVATPIAGVVGFAVQVRAVRTARLENTKLELEIQRLRQELAAAERTVAPATLEEIEKYGGIRFSRRERGPNPGNELESTRQRSALKTGVALYFALAIAVLFLVYLGLDIYRVVIWLRSLI